ncbi:hypothetical protein AWC27_18760 [Mycobacterium szulgai]|uniref:DUF7159 domain-containing protein n=2 Tax=Mycobacterium szulgai TaxID=1787 RepID=A0A1X2FDG8_MYCSZ|nr:hypothetical protein AWC27_18760 [Mycobacterium szulgai]
MVLVEGENADGVTVEEDEFAVAAAGSAIDQALAAILGTREGADDAGHQLTSIGVISTDLFEAAALRDALAARKVDNVMLISAFLAATALAQAVGQSIGYERIAMLFVEPESATLAVVEAADGAVADVRKEPLHGVDAMAELTELVAAAETLETRPDGLFVIGSGVDIALMKPQLETATSLVVSAPAEPETALARGAALASAHASSFVPSTDAFAYSAVPDEEADAPTAVMGTGEEAGLRESLQQRRPVLLLGTAGAVALVSAVVALEVSLALGIRPAAVGLQRIPGQNFIVPTMQAPVPPPAVASVPMHLQVPAAKLPSVNAFVPAAPVPAAAAVALPDPESPVRASSPILIPLPAVLPRESSPAPLLAPPVLPIPILPVPARAPVPESVPVSQPPTSVPVSQPPRSVPVSQPPRSVPVSQPPASVPVSRPPASVPVSRPPASAPVSQPPTHVPVSHPPSAVPVSKPPSPAPVSRPPTHVPMAPPPAHAPEPKPPVNLPAPKAPPAIPQQPRSVTPPVHVPSPSHSSGGGGSGHSFGGGGHK